MGDLIRRYWIPVLLSEELPERDGAPVQVTIMGEELVARSAIRSVGEGRSLYVPSRAASQAG